MPLSDKELAEEIAALRLAAGLPAKTSPIRKQSSTTRQAQSPRHTTQSSTHELMDVTTRLANLVQNSTAIARKLQSTEATEHMPNTSSWHRSYIPNDSNENSEDANVKISGHTNSAINPRRSKKQNIRKPIIPKQSIYPDESLDEDQNYIDPYISRHNYAGKSQNKVKPDESLAETVKFLENSFQQLQQQMSVLAADAATRRLSAPSPAAIMSNQANLMQNIHGMVEQKIGALSSLKKGSGVLDTVENTTNIISKIARFWPKFSTDEKVNASLGCTAMIIGTGILIATIINPALGLGMMLLAGACLAIGHKLCKSSLKRHVADPDAIDINENLTKHEQLTHKLSTSAQSGCKRQIKPSLLPEKELHQQNSKGKAISTNHPGKIASTSPHKPHKSVTKPKPYIPKRPARD